MTQIYTRHGIREIPTLTAHFIPSVCDTESEKTELLEVVWIDREKAQIRHPESNLVFKPVENIPLEWLIIEGEYPAFDDFVPVPIPLKEVKKGEYFTLRPVENPTEKQILIKGDYDRSERKYDCGYFCDISRNRYIPGNTLVYTDFTF